MRIDALEAALGAPPGAGFAVGHVLSGKTPPAPTPEEDEALTLADFALLAHLLAVAEGHDAPGQNAVHAPTATPIRLSGHAKKLNELHALGLRGIVKLLSVGANKMHLIRLLQRRDWLKLLQLLPKELLVNALRLFNKPKLLRLMLALPKPLLLKVLLKVYKIDDLIKRMPTAELINILRSKKLQSRELANGILTLDPQFILLILRRLYGDKDYSKLKNDEIFQILSQTSKDKILEVLKTMSFKALQPLIAGFVKQDPELLLQLSDGFIARMLQSATKLQLIQGAAVLPPELLIRILAQLPDGLLMIAAAQIDDAQFEDYLISQHPDLLMMLAELAA